MREIRFRGKERTGDWITGGYVQKNGAPSVDVPECDDCPEGAYYERAKAFLAKLEGGNDNEPR